MSQEIRKILILRFSSLGDIMMTTAMVRAVRLAYPRAQIDMVVREDFLDLVRHNPHLDQKIGLSRKEKLGGVLKLLKRLNGERYDLIYDAHRSLRTLFLMPLLKARSKAYFNKHYIRRSLALTFKLPLLRDNRRFLEKFVEPLERYGVTYDQQGPQMFVGERARETAEVKLPLPNAPTLRVGIIPSAQWPGKRWPLDRFREVLERMVQGTSFQMIVFGGPEDTFCTELCRQLPADRVVNAQGKLSIAESAALIERCDFVIANDTGLMHVADALGVPQILLLGPTSGGLGCLPFHPQSRVLEHDLWCRPCSKNGQAPCIRGRRICLENTQVADVLQAVDELTQGLLA